MIEPDHDEAGLDVEIMDFAGMLASSLTALLATMRLEAIGSPMIREANRVADILARDAEYAEAERARAAATIELADGLTVNVVDTVVPPTPEWLAKAPTRTVYVGGEKWTDRASHEPVKTVRRVVTSYPERMFLAGKLNERQLKACIWYQNQYEYSGFTGTVRTANLEPRIPTGNRGQLPFTPAQMDAQDELNNARLVIPTRLRALFERVVISDVSLTRAAKEVYAGRYPLDSFRCCADRVGDYIQYAPGRPDVEL